MDNLGQFLRAYAQEHSERIAYAITRGFRTQKLSFADVYSLSLKTATLLQTWKLQKGDTVVIWSPNMPEYPLLYFGCWLLGVVAVPIDVRTTEETLQAFVSKAGCRLGFKSASLAGSFPQTVAKTYHLEDLIELVRDLPQIEQLPEVFPDDLAEIAFTSGTTGIPKGVMLTHRNFLAVVSAFCQTFALKKDDRTLSLLPLSHTFEQVIDFLALFQMGITVAYLERMNQVTILRALKRHAITALAIVPQLLQLLMSGIEREIAKSKKQSIWFLLHALAPFLPMPVRRRIFAPIRQRLGPHLRLFGCGSAPLNRKLAQKWENLGIAIYEGYGATETTAVLTINTPAAKRLGSVGKALPGVHIQVDPQSHEIRAKGPGISHGYFQDSQKTQETFVDGWYKTGDIGNFDTEGYLYITGRESLRIVLPSGEKVYPEDIENKLNAHPLVIESCVVPVKRDEGERVRAVVITNSPAKLGEIIHQVNQKLSSHEQILEWSLWQEPLFPRTPLLKIDRNVVIEAIGGRETKREKVLASPKDQLHSLLAQVTNIPISQIKETDTLATDLGLDSLQRVELLSLIEQDVGVVISETGITAETTVGQLREQVKTAEVVPVDITSHMFNYTSLLVSTRVFLQNVLVFPLHSLFVPLHIYGQENLVGLQLPAVFCFNHIGIMDAVCVLRAFNPSLRRQLAIAATRDLWREWRRGFVEFFGGGFPVDTRAHIKAFLEQVGELLDHGFSILIAPEGGISKDGTLQAFKSGIGFIAVHMNVPVVPIKIDPAYQKIFPPMDASLLENLPKARKSVDVHIGKPMTFSQQTSIEQATDKIRQAMLEL
jgi:long-chain acyl-CoA synthetase